MGALLKLCQGLEQPNHRSDPDRECSPGTILTVLFHHSLMNFFSLLFSLLLFLACDLSLLYIISTPGESHFTTLPSDARAVGSD